MPRLQLRRLPHRPNPDPNPSLSLRLPPMWLRKANHDPNDYHSSTDGHTSDPNSAHAPDDLPSECHLPNMLWSLLEHPFHPGNDVQSDQHPMRYVHLQALPCRGLLVQLSTADLQWVYQGWMPVVRLCAQSFIYEYEHEYEHYKDCSSDFNSPSAWYEGGQGR